MTNRALRRLGPSLVLDADGYPHINYYDVTNADLKHVAKSASGWSDPQIVDAGESVGLGSDDR